MNERKRGGQGLVTNNLAIKGKANVRRQRNRLSELLEKKSSLNLAE